MYYMSGLLWIHKKPDHIDTAILNISILYNFFYLEYLFFSIFSN